MGDKCEVTLLITGYDTQVRGESCWWRVQVYMCWQQELRMVRRRLWCGHRQK